MNIQNFYDSFPVMGKGMLGIFVVTTVIMLAIYLLNKVSKGIGAKSDDED